MKFELTNEQRRYLGLSQTEASWELVRLNKHFFLYFDGDILRKQITVDSSLYLENDLYQKTAEGRSILLPQTKSGKPKKLNYATLQSCTPVGSYFKWVHSMIMIGNFTSQRSYYSSYGSEVFYPDIDSLKSWLKNWMAESSKEDLEDIEKFHQEKRKHCKIKEGDFFYFKIGRREYGFGRVMLDVRALRKQIQSGEIKEAHYGFNQLMGPPLLVKVYKKICTSTAVNLKELQQCEAFPTQTIMDNRLYYGEYPILGNLPLQADELEFTISYGQKLNNTGTSVYLQYGLIYLELETTAVADYLKQNAAEDSANIYASSCYACSAISMDLPVTRNIPLMRQAIAKKNIEVGFRNSLHDQLQITDLRHSLNLEAKQKIFTLFGLDANKSYAENWELYKKINPNAKDSPVP